MSQLLMSVIVTVVITIMFCVVYLQICKMYPNWSCLYTVTGPITIHKYHVHYPLLLNKSTLLNLIKYLHKIDTVMVL